MRTIGLVLWFAAFNVAGMSPSQAADIEEGKWEITTEMKMEGMPFTIPPMTHSQCLSAEDVVPHNPQGAEECTFTDHQVEGGTVTWTMECSGAGGKTVNKGSITYAGDRMNGTIDILNQGAPPMKSIITGKRIGPCN